MFLLGSLSLTSIMVDIDTDVRIFPTRPCGPSDISSFAIFMDGSQNNDCHP